MDSSPCSDFIERAMNLSRAIETANSRARTLESVYYVAPEDGCDRRQAALFNVQRILLVLPWRTQQAGDSLSAPVWNGAGHRSRDLGTCDGALLVHPAVARNWLRLRVDRPFWNRRQSARYFWASILVIH